ncbi:MAG TPA: SCO family protein [Candidatus Acidoferrales bacterium]|nr:SCO family protein [Candidatus Acidoferrales bacterium]
MPASLPHLGRIAVGRVALAAALALAGAAGCSRGQIQGIRPAPQYTLTNQLGQRVPSSSLRGKVQIVTFLFPYCTTYCPLIAQRLATFEHARERDGLADRVQIVAFNVDPTGSGPKAMSAFMREYGWNPSDTHWQYLTGSAAEIHRVVRDGYMIDYERVTLAEEARDEALEKKAGTYVAEPEVQNKVADAAHVDYDVVHNDLLEIVSPTGEIVKIFDDAEKVRGAELLLAVQAAANQ